MQDNEPTLQQNNSAQKTSEFPQEISIFDILIKLKHNSKKITALTVGAGLLGFSASFLLKPQFTSTASFLPPQQQNSATNLLQSLGSLGGIASAAAGIKNPAEQYVAFLNSASIENRLLDRFGLVKRYNKNLRIDARNELKKKVTITAGKDGIITINFQDTEPELSAAIANAYIEELGTLLNRLAVTEAQQRRNFFGKQLDEAKKDLSDAQRQLSESGVGASTLNASIATAVEGPAVLRTQIASLEVQIASLRSSYTDASSEIRQAVARLNALRNELRKVEKDSALPRNGQGDYIAKYREFKYRETLYEIFAKQYELAKVDESKEGLIQVIDNAAPAEKKSSPRRSIISIAAACLTLFLSIFYFTIREILTKSRRQ